MNPQVKTALAVATPIVLMVLQLLLKDKLNVYEHIGALGLLTLIAVLNVFHVSARVVGILQGLLSAINTAAQAQNGAATSSVPEQSAIMAARQIVRAQAKLPAVIALLCLLLVSCTPQQAKTAENLISPGITCAEAVVLDLAGASDPVQVVTQCLPFGAVAVQDVITIAKQLFAQLFPVTDAGEQAASPLKVRLGKFISK